MSRIANVLKNHALLVLMLGHFTNDMFAGVLAILYPVLKLKFGLSNAEIGFVTLTYTSLSSLTQPLFGHFADRYNRRWLPPLTILLGGIFVSMYGIAPTFPIMLTLAGLAGMCSGAFHPLGATNAAAVIEDHQRNTALSLYTVGGTSGYALGPLMGALLVSVAGLRGTLFLLIPGLVSSALIFSQMHVVERVRNARAALTATLPRVAAAKGPLARIVGVTMLRSWAFLSLVQFTPIFYSELGYSPAFYGPLVSVIILAGAVGTLIGGAWADRIGQKRVVVSTLLLAIPLLVLYVAWPGPQALVTGTLMGMASDASLSITLVMAQQLAPGRVGMASGIILGLGFVTGGIGVPITGKLADAFGVQTALMSLSVLAVLGFLLALTIPSDASLSARMGREPAPEPRAVPSPARNVAGAGK